MPAHDSQRTISLIPCLAYGPPSNSTWRSRTLMRRSWISTYLILLCSISVYGHQPLPEDRGAAGLAQSLRRLQTVGRVAYFIAHPDDEESGMVTLLTRGRGYEVTFLMPSRGGASQDNVSS